MKKHFENLFLLKKNVYAATVGGGMSFYNLVKLTNEQSKKYLDVKTLNI